MLSSRFYFFCICLLHFSLVSSLFASKAIINSNLVLEIDGKKVFPIGFTLPPTVDGKTPTGKNAIQELSDAGATFLRGGRLSPNWNPEHFAEEKKMQDAAARYGMHCWLNLHELSSIAPGDTEKEALLRKVITTFRNYPGMGVYKGEDEP